MNWLNVLKRANIENDFNIGMKEAHFMMAVVRYVLIHHIKIRNPVNFVWLRFVYIWLLTLCLCQPAHFVLMKLISVNDCGESEKIEREREDRREWKKRFFVIVMIVIRHSNPINRLFEWNIKLSWISSCNFVHIHS